MFGGFCLHNAKTSSVPHGNISAQLHQITFSVHSGVLRILPPQCSKITVNHLLNSVTTGSQDHVSYHSKWWYFKWTNRIWNRYPSPMSKYVLFKFSTWGGGLTKALGLSLSEVRRNILGFFVPHYFGPPFRDDESCLPDGNVTRKIQLVMVKHSEMKRALLLLGI